MLLTHLGHACLLVEIGDERILIDPGNFSAGFDDLHDLSAVVITHQHPDHLDPERLPALVRANPAVRLLCDPGSVEVLAELGLDGEAHQGEAAIGAVTLTSVGEIHALVHDDLPRVPNVGVVLRADGEPSLFHPGDALDQDPGPIDVIAFPLNAPWQRSREMTDFLRRLNPAVAVPIHDSLLSEAGRALYLRQADLLGGADTEIRDLADAGTATFTV
ncbi:MBL fold metallo-hydrolase [Knoellia sp. CPCC 206453]|uniref:MBL fold metallo-hydrolase n=1 Tax=Knoellia pratensis TaxID=3404796 RepID=UPI003619AACD